MICVTGCREPSPRRARQGGVERGRRRLGLRLQQLAAGIHRGLHRV